MVRQVIPRHFERVCIARQPHMQHFVDVVDKIDNGIWGRRTVDMVNTIEYNSEKCL